MIKYKVKLLVKNTLYNIKLHSQMLKTKNLSIISCKNMKSSQRQHIMWMLSSMQTSLNRNFPSETMFLHIMFCGFYFYKIHLYRFPGWVHEPFPVMSSQSLHMFHSIGCNFSLILVEYTFSINSSQNYLAFSIHWVTFSFKGMYM